jgi:hypothetical protein
MGTIEAPVRPAAFTVRTNAGPHLHGRVLLEVLIAVSVVESLQFLVTRSWGSILFEPLLWVVTVPFTAHTASGTITWGGGELLTILFTLVLLRIMDGTSGKGMAAELGLAPPRRSLLASLAVVVPVALAAVVASVTVPDPRSNLSSPQFFAAQLVFVAANELLYRGYVFGHLVKHEGWSWVWAATLTSVLYTLVFLLTRLYSPFITQAGPPTVAPAAEACALSFLLCGVYSLTRGNLYACVGLHLGWLLGRGGPAAARPLLLGGTAFAAVICVMWYARLRPHLPDLRRTAAPSG